MLKFAVDSLDGLDEAVKPLYAANDADGRFYLQVEGVVAKSKLDEFRNNNIELSKQLDRLKGIDPATYQDTLAKLEAFKDVDPGKYRALLKMETEGKFTGKTDEEVTAMINAAVGAVKAEYEPKVAEISRLTQEVQTKDSQLAVLLIDNVVRDAAVKAGVAPTAFDDVLLRAKATFRLINGVPTPHDDKGAVIYGRDGSSPMSPTDWITNLKKTAPHLFPQSQGAGAPGAKGGAGAAAAKGAMTPNQKISAGLAARQA